MKANINFLCDHACIRKSRKKGIRGCLFIESGCLITEKWMWCLSFL